VYAVVVLIQVNVQSVVSSEEDLVSSPSRDSQDLEVGTVMVFVVVKTQELTSIVAEVLAISNVAKTNTSTFVFFQDPERGISELVVGVVVSVRLVVSTSQVFTMLVPELNVLVPVVPAEILKVRVRHYGCVPCQLYFLALKSRAD